MSQTAKNSAKSAVSGNRKAGSPAGKISAASASAASEPKKQKLTLWAEWNENDINAEKWEGVGKAKDAKTKPTSAPASHGFEDPDPKFEYPYSIQSRIDSFKRPSEIYDKATQIVDAENGLENFDLVTPNEHLHNSETIRWVISQIHTLWDMCKKEIKPSAISSASPSQLHDTEPITNKALAAGRLWRPWEHIYAISKVVKGPFIPTYNPYGKYVVRLYFMGTWRKVVIDDLMPVDEKGMFLLPVTSIPGEIWPLLLTKALLKIISLDFNPADSATEFNDVSIISCFTGWLPEPLPLRFGHMNEVWKFLKETLPKYQWGDEKLKLAIEDEPIAVLDTNELKEDTNTDKDNKSDAKSLKKAKEIKNSSGKDTKMDKHKKDVKDKKGKSTTDDQVMEESFSPEFPEMVVFASFTDLPLNKLSASTEVADRRERLRKYTLNHDFSNPVWITCTRDIPLNPPPPPEKIPVWKTIRQKKKHVVPSDEPIPSMPIKPDQWIELKSPYVGYKTPSTIPVMVTNRTNSRFSRIRSRPQTGIEGIEEIDEKSIALENLKSESPTELNKINVDVTNVDLKDDLHSDNKSSLLKPKTGKQTADSVKSNSFIKKEREKSIDNSEYQLKIGASLGSKAGGGSTNLSVTRMEDDTKSIKTSKSNEIKHGVFDAQVPGSSLGNQSANAIGIEINVNDKLTQDTSSKNDDKNKLWMDFEDFFICFKSILVYHKPTSFKYNEKYSDLRQVIPQQKFDKKKDTSSSLLQMGPLLDEKSPKLLFVDSLQPIELIVSYACLSRWYETKLELPEKLGKLSKKNESLAVDHDAMSVAETIREIMPLQPGYLMAEPYSWKSLVTGQPLLRIHTTAIRSSFLSLPPGRHVLKFITYGPIGYHLNIVSNTKFALGDEEEIMPKLTDESCRFVDQALHIMKSLTEAIKSFVDVTKQKQTLELLYASVSPLTDAYLAKNHYNESFTRRALYDTFHNSLYEMLRKAIGDSVDAEMAFAWRAFFFDCQTPDILSLKDRRPETSSTNRGSAKKLDKKKQEPAASAGKGEKSEKGEKNDKADKGDKGDKTDKGDKQNVSSANPNSEKVEKDNADERLEYWKTHIPTANEHIATIKIQSLWRGFYARKIYQSRIPGTPKNHQVSEQLKKSMQFVEQSIHENALYLFRAMFRLNPSIMQYYSFYKDEWNRISYIDYNGSYLDQVSNSWFIIFRDIFYATEDVLLLPKIYCNLNNCLLKVINNDTYKEIPKVFNKVSPYTYTKNKKGYTIIAESRIMDQPASPGRWRLRLIGSSPVLLAPRGNKPEIISAFDTRDTRDYYIPNENKLIMRYKVTVSDDHLVSLQITTSKPDVYLKFSIYDNGEEILSVHGKGTAVIPAFIFLKDRETNATSRPPSKTFSSGRASKNINNPPESKSKDNKSKRSSSANSNNDPKERNANSRSSSQQSIAIDQEDDDQPKTHRYILEAIVLKDSWPLTPSQWSFANQLKENEAAELKVFAKDRALSPSKESKANSSESKGAALKAAKAKAQKKGTPAPPTTSRPASSAFDINKPHWTLKWVSDATCADVIEVKKDTDRIEEIKALKKAWEAHENGRAAKATIARADFLKAHQIKTDGAVTDDESEKPPEEEQSQQSQQTPVQQTPQNIQATTPKVVEPKSSKEPKAKQSVAGDEVKSSKSSKQKKDKEKADSVKASQELIPQINEQSANESITIEEPLLNRPPTPPKPKFYLPPIDVAPFIRINNFSPIIKDENFEKEQTQMRKLEMDNFLTFKDQIQKFREEEKKFRLHQKLKQIEECEVLQAKLDASRKEIFEPREAFRQIFLDAERKRLEELANLEALMTQHKPDPKDKKKGSAGKAKGKK